MFLLVWFQLLLLPLSAAFSPSPVHLFVVSSRKWSLRAASYYGWNDEERSIITSGISEESTAELARLAAAFCPGLHLRDIQHVRVLSVNDSELHIEAVVCEQGGCVTLDVPVTFPHPCPPEDDDDHLVECVLGNIHDLDEQAIQVLEKIEWDETHAEETGDQRRKLQALRDTEDVTLPDWWTHPGFDHKLAVECDSIRSLLNEHEFADQVKTLATYALIQAGEEELEVDQAAVVALGPSGLVLRVRAHELLQLFATTNLLPQQQQQQQLVQIPVPFGTTVQDSSSLQSAVLGVVALAESFFDS